MSVSDKELSHEDKLLIQEMNRRAIEVLRMLGLAECCGEDKDKCKCQN